MKARLIPIFFGSDRDQEFNTQLAALTGLLADEVEFLSPLPLGTPLPEADAVVLPQLLGDAYRQTAALGAIELPILVITSPFGTLSMWDWEITDYLQSEGIATIAPYRLEQTRRICRALRAKRELKQAAFLVYQDNPGAGFQASIFKRFYWWEDECARRMEQQFGVRILKKSLRELGERAQKISDQEADEAWRERPEPIGEIAPSALRSAVKLYLAVRRDLDEDQSICAVGTNCLNESHFCDTTPCLAWNRLYEERGLIWGCEADTMSIVSKYLLHKSIGAPIMMTNLYPFLLGDAALKHERIEHFPSVDAEPENHLLVAHCGYLGVVPKSFATEWTLRKKVLAIVDDNATAIDARLPTGDVTLAKLHATMNKMTVAEGRLNGYAQFPGSDCLNGGVIRVHNGHQLISSLASHHYLLMTGHHLVDIRMVARIFGLAIQEIGR